MKNYNAVSSSILVRVWCICSANFTYADIDECELFLAPSPGLGRGVFAGIKIPSGEIVQDSITLKIPEAFRLNRYNWMVDNYYWGNNDNDTISLEFGAGMFFNHQNPSTVYHTFRHHTPHSFDQKLAHSTYTTAPLIASRDILPGEELSISYGEENKWLEERGVIIKEVTNTSSSMRKIEDLKKNGHCITQVKVEKSTLPFAGRGLFASRDFAKGEILTISPVILLPKDEVTELGKYSDSVLQNYCIALTNSSVLFLPLGVGSLANHAFKPNMELEIFWWEHTDKIEKKRKLNSTLLELIQEKSAPLDIAYRATRDVYQGEEITYNYGEGWTSSWASHLAALNDWLVKTAKMKGEGKEYLIKRPRFLSYIEAPKKLYF